MSEFSCPVIQIKNIKNHPNADRLDIAQIFDFFVIVTKDTLKPGDKVVYVPDGSVLPDELIDKMGIRNFLAGSKHNRVRPARIRGVISQGLIISPNLFPEINNIAIMADMAEYFGIKKYIPDIPTCMDGEVFHEHGIGMKYDIENIQRYPNVFVTDEIVYCSEKIHGSFCQIAISSNTHIETFGKNNNIYVSSKGLSSDGLFFKNNEKNEKFKNIYIRALEQYITTIEEISKEYQNINLFGEVYGQGIQDLTYGEKFNIRFFDIAINGIYLSYPEFIDFCNKFNLERVPEIFVGAFNQEKIMELAQQPSLIGGKLREGIVVKPIKERRDHILGRVILKAINPKYLIRENGTEFN